LKQGGEGRVQGSNSQRDGARKATERSFLFMEEWQCQ